ncbi:FAD-binding oxidoreductase [Kribbella qitaiheensis]|uniref:FAD-binding oxidoreductase n=1 Tax=Kribbella qitaiheensis TaxID=1544730 RepID=UPI00362433EC
MTLCWRCTGRQSPSSTRPGTSSRATLGGMIANNACGAHSVTWSTTADNLRLLEVILADGTRWHRPMSAHPLMPVRILLGNQPNKRFI